MDMPSMGMGPNSTICPPPWLNAADYPYRGGQLDARFCVDATDTLFCCLPCPVTDWVFGDLTRERSLIANYVAIPSLTFNILLLLTYAVLPEEKSHRHYLSIGLTCSLVILSIAFIIPLGTKPNFCFDTITPHNMRSDVGCAFTGALLEIGAMGTVVWIFLRSIWTSLRIGFDFKHTSIYKYVSIALGVILPFFFFALSFPLTGVSYRIGNVCIPNAHASFQTWFAWLIIFASLGGITLFATIVFCIIKFAKSAMIGGGGGAQRGHLSTPSAGSGNPADVAKGVPPTSRQKRRTTRYEWARVRRVLALQWRSIVLAFMVVNETIFFALVFSQSTIAAAVEEQHINPRTMQWAECLVLSGGDKESCLHLSDGLGLSGPRVVATFMLLASIGVGVSLLMVRWSMLTGWYELLSDPKRLLHNLNPRKASVSSQDFISGNEPKHLSVPMPLGSEESPVRRRSAAPVAGDAEGKESGSVQSADEKWTKVELEEEGRKASVKPAVDEAEVLV